MPCKVISRRNNSMEKTMEMEMDDELKREQDHLYAVVENALHGFGEWDVGDPVTWAILHVVRAQTDLAHAIDEYANYNENKYGVEVAIEERRKAIAALQEALAQEPRGYQ
jgi:hypothetical protein